MQCQVVCSQVFLLSLVVKCLLLLASNGESILTALLLLAVQVLMDVL